MYKCGLLVAGTIGLLVARILSLPANAEHFAFGTLLATETGDNTIAPGPRLSQADSNIKRLPDEQVAALASNLLHWIIQRTTLQMPSSPTVLFLPADTLLKLYRDTITDDIHDPLELRAFYQPSNITIYLHDTWSRIDLVDKSILLHELVHHVQEQNKMTFPCRGAKERMAIDLQVQWLREHGVSSPYEAIGMDEFTVFVLTSCYRDE